jgi:hypothetical protein
VLSLHLGGREPRFGRFNGRFGTTSRLICSAHSSIEAGTPLAVPMGKWLAKTLCRDSACPVAYGPPWLFWSRAVSESTSSRVVRCVFASYWLPSVSPDCKYLEAWAACKRCRRPNRHGPTIGTTTQLNMQDMLFRGHGEGRPCSRPTPQFEDHCGLTRQSCGVGSGEGCSWGKIEHRSLTAFDGCEKFRCCEWCSPLDQTT